MDIEPSTIDPAILHRLREAELVFCFLDYDGTLAPLASTPDEAFPVSGTDGLLRQLAAAPGTRVAIVTGRTIADVRRFLDVPGVDYAGIHGHELQFARKRQRLTQATGALRVVLPAIKQRVAQALGDRAGVVIEDKGVALACHYRLASRQDKASARQAIAAIARAYRRKGVPLMMTFGHEVVEIRPEGVNKGDVVEALLGTCAQPPLCVYIGDDRTDADAFAVLPADSITIHVGSAEEPNPAQYSLPGPPEVHGFLQAFLAARRARPDGSKEM